MQISDILSRDRVCCGVEAASKKRVLEMVSEHLRDATTGISSAHAIFDVLVARERLGSTCLGHGVALPHARMPDIDTTSGVFLGLKEGVDFDAPDGAPVDLVFGLLVPEKSTEEHLEILAALAEAFSDSALRDRIRGCPSEDSVYELLTERPVATK